MIFHIISLTSKILGIPRTWQRENHLVRSDRSTKGLLKVQRVASRTTGWGQNKRLAKQKGCVHSPKNLQKGELGPLMVAVFSPYPDLHIIERTWGLRLTAPEHV